MNREAPGSNTQVPSDTRTKQWPDLAAVLSETVEDHHGRERSQVCFSRPLYQNGNIRFGMKQKPLLTIITGVLAIFAVAQSPPVSVTPLPVTPVSPVISGSKMPVGGNITSLRPGFTPDDLAKATQSMAYLSPGAIARCGTIFWEIFWTPDPAAGNFRGIDQTIALAAQYKVRPLFLLSPTPYPGSPWYSGKTFTDWWVPDRSTWPAVFSCTDALVDHIQKVCKAAGLNPMYQLLNEPAGRMANPPIGNKPGGSSLTEFGQWDPSLHEFMYGICGVLDKYKVPAANIVSPAISCVGENNKREATEWLSYQPPAQFDWLKRCGWIAFNYRFSAGWATDPATREREITNGFSNCGRYLEWCIGQRAELKGKRVILTEVYVTPGDTGQEIGADLTYGRNRAFSEWSSRGWTACVWGLLPTEADDPTNKWLYYGGWGGWLNSLRTAPPIDKPATPVTGTATDSTAAKTKSGG